MPEHFNFSLVLVREPWGKWWGLPEPYALKWHLMDTAAAAYVLWEMHLPEGLRGWIGGQLGLPGDETRWFVAFLAGLHDVGKACPCFQDQTPARGTVGWIHHANVTYLTLSQLLRGPGREYEPFARSSPYRMAELLGGHHGFFQETDRRLGRSGTPRFEDRLGGAPWQDERRRQVEMLRMLLGQPRIPDEIPGPVAAVLAGLVILADWTASDTKWIETSQMKASTDPRIRWSQTVSSIRNRLSGLGVSVPVLAETVSTERLIGHPPNPLQASIEEDFHPAGPGLLVITSSTASGKTEAAFLAVHRLGAVTGRPGMVMSLPTQATTNAMWIRGTGFAGQVAASDRPVTLAHTMSAFFEPYRVYCADDPVMDWLNGRHKPLLAGMSVVTIDQILIAALPITFNMLRLWAILGKTLVVDEVHAADPYMLALLARLLSWCGHFGISVVLLSATLPRHISRELTIAYLSGVGDTGPSSADLAIETPSYPGWLFTAADGGVHRPTQGSLQAMREYGKRSARVKYLRYERGTRLARIARYVNSAVAEGGCVAVVCSTVASAQNTYATMAAALRRLPPSPDAVQTWLLHARLPYHRRLGIENEIITRFGNNPTDDLPRPRTGIVVTTSILEQSLDVDFDLVISDLVPIAQLIQRLGRAWRHHRDNRPGWIPEPALVVLDPLLERFPAEWTSIYSEYELAATRRLLEGHDGTLVVPDDVDDLVQAVHDQGLPTIDDAVAWLWADRRATKIRDGASARNRAIPVPHMLGWLRELSDPNITDKDATARLGVDNLWLIPQYIGPDGRTWLDPERTQPFPIGRPVHTEIMAMMNASVRCPAAWTQGWENPLAEQWKRTPLGRDALSFPAPAYGGLRLDPVLGLVKEGLHDDL
ncbi:CRISPR-associated helicase Cas3' [Nocardia sp. NPDC088792]|uniref:CRISPR-associated helicase Cas3' n=1 Tax=Nocardia sp. NPDC088792 TaxID=3364332 RepID=UPI0037FDD3B7